MSLDIGFDTQVPSLPQGGGAVSGLGETFSPDLSTGTGSLAINLDLPNGPNGIGPRLSLRYDTAGGNGPFGMGFSLPLPRLVRSTVQGFPHYDATDVLMLEGAGELVALGGGAYRPQVDGGAWRAEALNAGFRLIDREGLYYYLGVDPAARLIDASQSSGAGTSKIYAWHLERIEDALGNVVHFTWLRDSNQLYLSKLSYGVYEVQFHYEHRPDPIRWGRAGFLITTTLRCTDIELHLPAEAQPLIRRWTLTYTQDEANGCSLVSGVILSGFDEHNKRLDTPPLRLGYTSFQPRTLTRFKNVDDGAPPSPLVRTGRRVELVDWNGDGLPDLIEIAAGGSSRVWPNRGEYTWGRPQFVEELPLFAEATTPVGLVDMNGDGVADLLRLDRLTDGYIPRIPGGGFDRLVAWRQAPLVSLTANNVRFVDLDGDGIVDLLSSSDDFLTLFYRTDPDGWVARPQVLSRRQAPDVSLTDPHVFLADMTGDGSDDLVKVDGGGVTYWPYLGCGNWDAPVVMDHPPTLPFDVRIERLFLSDVDGDGCTDLIYLDEEGRVLYWVNQGGNRFSDMRQINYVPVGPIADVRLADMNGSGTAGIVWSSSDPFEREAVYFYLDFSGANKPLLLHSIDNGVGGVTNITYSTSARQAAMAVSEGQPWSTFLPVVIPVVVGVTMTDAATHDSSTKAFRYYDGRYDGVLREFAGFGYVNQDELGDEVAPTLRTTTWFHIGVDPANPQETMSLEERRHLRAIRGRIYRQERYGLDGTSQQSMPYDRLEQQWTVISEATAGGPVDIPRLLASTRSTFERTATAAAVITTTYTAWDNNLNVTDSLQVSEVPGNPALQKRLRTHTAFAADPNKRFLSRAWRVQQFGEGNTIIGDTITEFDGKPEGTIGAQGLVTKRSALVLTDALVTAVYGATPPNFAALGYYKRPGEQGWWADQGSYLRTEDAHGLHGRVTGPRGAVTTFDFDRNKTYPVRMTDPRGNTVTVEHDYRVCRVKQLTDASGASYTSGFDALARTTTTSEPGDSTAFPTITYNYVTTTLPVETTRRTRAESGTNTTVDQREIFDGLGRIVERRVQDDTGEIVVMHQVYNARGFVARTYLEYRPASAAFADPGDDVPHITYTYDALGRLTRQQNADGSIRTIAYGPLLIEEADEEDTRTDVGATHTGTPTQKKIDATGRIQAVLLNQGGRLIQSTYQYNEKGDLLLYTDASGGTVRIWYDLLERPLRTERPEHTTISVFDAIGNAVEARSLAGTLIFREFDECNRPTKVRYHTATSAPVIQFTYHDTGHTRPPEAGAHTAGGRCVRIDDEGGMTTFDYDERGRLALKKSHPAGVAHTYELHFAYRPDGQLDRIVYPDGGSGSATVHYSYDKRGNVNSVPSFVNEIEYDLAGRRSRIELANGTVQTFTYNEQTRRLAALRLAGPGGTLRSTQYDMDLVGNLLSITSPDPKLTMTYVYDDLYRLIEANTVEGENWSYRYDNIGNLTHKSDVGDYRYGEHGAPSTCLTSAGTHSFTYTSLGEMRDTPWGTQTFDPLGRMIRIVGPGGHGQLDFRYDYAGRRLSARSSGGVNPAVNLVTPDALYSLEDGALVLNIFDGQGIIARKKEGGQTVFLHADHLGGLACVSNASGQLITALRYDPYGLLLERTGTAAAPPIGFTGGVPDLWSGLLYLNARYYHPMFGRFVSPDLIVQNIYDPLTWTSYIYCRDNPTTYVDPSGRDFWGIFIAALAIVALIVVTIVCVVLDVFSFGSLTPLLAVGVIALGAVVGGIVGGLAASAKGGSTEDIVTGVLVGAAVGGWGAFFSLFGGAAVGGLLPAHSFIGAVASGAVSGAINGAAIGFATGYAGGKGSLDDIATKTWQGLVVGLVTGAIIGGVSYFIKPPTTSIREDFNSSLKPQIPQATGAGASAGLPPAPSGLPVPAAPPDVTFGQALSTTGTGILAKTGGAVALNILQTVLSNPAGVAASEVLFADAAAAVWDLGYLKPLLEQLGVVKVVSGKF